MSPPEPTASPPGPTSSSSVGADPTHRHRRALRRGLGLSAAVHIVLILLYPLISDRMTPEPEALPPDDRDPPARAMEVLVLDDAPPEAEAEPDPAQELPAPETEEEEPEEPEVEPVPEPPPFPVVTPIPAEDPDEPEEVEEEETRSVAERLRPQVRDPRLWVPLDEYTEMTDAERAQAFLDGMIRSWNDSMAVAAALSEDAVDWTYTDDEGRRWGLSPGRLHLGDFSVPLPFNFEAPRTPGDYVRDWVYDDIRRGAINFEMRQTWAERARAIRRRMDEERERRRDDGGGGP